MQTGRARSGTVLLLGLALLLSACIGDAPAPTPAPSPTASAPPVATSGDGTLRWGLGADPTSLDPRRIVRDEDAVLVDALFDSLTRLGPEQEAVPALAASWEADADALGFTFLLDSAARWHDGTPVVAEDVVRGLTRVADGTLSPPSLHAGLLADVEGFAGAQQGLGLPGLAALDDRTLRVELSRPVPELPLLLAHPALAPVPVQAVEDPGSFGERPVGNGPFELVDAWVHNQFVRLVPSDTHPAPDALGGVVFRIYADDVDREVRMAALTEGQLQVAHLPAGQRAETASALGRSGAAGGQGVHEGLTDQLSLLVFDQERPPFDDERFRRGVSMLIDRASLAARTDGARVPADAIVPPVLAGSQDGVCPWCRHDPETAAALITQVLAEQPPDAPFAPIVIQTSSDELHGRMAEALSVALRSFGLEVSVVRPDVAGYLDAVVEDGPAVVRLGWSAEEPTLRAWAEGLFGSGALPAIVSGWQPPALTELLGEATASQLASERRLAWQQIERLALDAAVVAPLFFYRHDLVVGPGVTGLVVDPYGNVDLAAVRLVRTAP